MKTRPDVDPITAALACLVIIAFVATFLTQGVLAFGLVRRSSLLVERLEGRVVWSWLWPAAHTQSVPGCNTMEE